MRMRMRDIQRSKLATLTTIDDGLQIQPWFILVRQRDVPGADMLALDAR